MALLKPIKDFLIIENNKLISFFVRIILEMSILAAIQFSFVHKSILFFLYSAGGNLIENITLQSSTHTRYNFTELSTKRIEFYRSQHFIEDTILQRSTHKGYNFTELNTQRIQFYRAQNIEDTILQSLSHRGYNFTELKNRKYNFTELNTYRI